MYIVQLTFHTYNLEVLTHYTKQLQKLYKEVAESTCKETIFSYAYF